MRERIQALLPRRYRYLARGAVWSLTSLFFAGNRVECPVCRRTARRWVSLGFPNELCPHCSASERQRLLILYLRDRVAFTDRPLTILHFGAEYCFVRRLRKIPSVTYIAADLDPPPGGRRMDITAIPLDDRSVDLVICSHVLEHVQDDAKAMRELRRVLRSAGMALVMGPVDYDRQTTYEDASIVSPRARQAAFHQRDHVRIYGADFDERLRAAGFRVDATRYALSLGEEATQRHGLTSEDIIYICT